MDSTSTHSDNRERKAAKTRTGERRAIAGGITTIALIAVAVVVAAAAGAYAFNTANNAQGGIKAVIENVELIRDSTGAGTFVATVKNNGGVHISSAAVSIPSVTGASITINDIAPGQTKSGTASVTAANMGSSVAGTVLTGTVTYTGPDGTTATDTFSVTVKTL
ncbi:MAG TPA: hypothetical protein VF172_08460 [Nitrososphaera sp.]|jgi:hypothetical protein